MICCFTNNDMDKITDTIWLGNHEAATNINNLKKEGIKKVLTVIDFSVPSYSEKDEINQKVFKVIDFPTQNIIKYFGECINFMKGNDKILVHCMGGASRSATIVTAYIMWYKKKSYKKALDFVSKKRSCVCPNNGFREQLQMFEKLLKDNDYDLNKIDFNNIKWEAKLSNDFQSYF